MNATTASDAPQSPVGAERKASGVIGYVLIFALAVAGGARQLDPLWHLAVDGFEALARAQYKMHLAGQNVNADGQAELAVYLGGKDITALQIWADAHDGVGTRDSALPGWYVVTASPEQAGRVAEVLGEQSFVHAVLRNRGLWICH